jgi:hypothetical protein
MKRTRTEIEAEAAVALLRSMLTAYGDVLPAAMLAARRELDELDGLVAQRFTGLPGGGAAELTSVERIAGQRIAASGNVAQLRDDLAAITSLLLSAIRVARSISGWAPTPATRCSDSQHGRDGASEWGEPLCEELAAKAGLCSACYQRERRWRQREGLAARDVVDAA